MIDYIEVIYNLSKDIVVKGKPIDEESNIKIPKPYDSWWFPDFFTTNIRFMYKIASKQFHRVNFLAGQAKILPKECLSHHRSDPYGIGITT